MSLIQETLLLLLTKGQKQEMILMQETLLPIEQLFTVLL
jgi:hypothetical protein